jgi:hypothetical protein
MATTSFTALRRFAGIGFALLFSLCLCVEAAGQGASPLVTSSVATGLGAPATTGPFFQNPAGGGAVITLLAKGSSGPGGGWANYGIALDKYDNMYLSNNWNGGLQFIPYDPAHKTWNTAANKTLYPIGNFTGYFQADAMATNSSGLFVMDSQCCSPAITEWTSDAQGNATTGINILQNITSRVRSMALDNAGNIFIWEDGGIPHVLEIPAGTSGLSDDKSLATVDPTTVDPTTGKTVQLLTSITGVAVDAAGNLYVGDGSLGVFMVPNQNGTLNPAAWVMVSPVPAQGQIAIDKATDTLFIPTGANWNGIQYVASVSLGNAELGSSPVGTQSTTPTTIYYSFSTPNPVTPARFVIQEDGAATPDFTVVSGGNCAAGTTYPIPGSATQSGNPQYYCSLKVALNPQHVGSLSAQLLMQTSQTVNQQKVYTTVSTTTLHGIGLAASIETAPALESSIGGALKTPTQVATDLWGNIYLADAGLKKVLMYSAGSGASAAGVSVGTGLTAPTGVAVDGNGDVFIADSGSIYEVPFVAGALNNAGQVKLTSGLGTNLKLAADGLGHLYVADPDNARVVELYNLGGSFLANGQVEVFLTAGFTAPSFVAVDASNNLYVIDGSNLFELLNGSLATLSSSLSNATGLAIDPSGAIYISSTAGTVRVPYVSGALNFGSSTTIASSVTNSTSVALDNLGNAYLTDGTALNVHVVTANGSVTLPTPATLTSSTSAGITITNDGNAPLNVTGYTSTNPADFSGTDVSCVSSSPLAPGNSCQTSVVFSPGPGEQGTLTSTIGIQSNAVNAPVVVNASGVGAALGATVSTITVGSKPEVINTPVTVTVAAKSGTAVPTGQVTVSYTTFTPYGCAGSANDLAPCPGGVAESVPLPSTATVTATLTNGSVTLNLSPVMAGNGNFSVTYKGDRVFGRSTATTTATVAKSAITGITLPANDAATYPYLPYILETFTGGGQPPYFLPDYWVYKFTVTVNAPVGIPTGILTFQDKYQAGVSTTLTTGPACPSSNGGVLPLTLTGRASLVAGCLTMPQNVTYTPVASTHVITPIYSGDANFLAYTGPVSTTFIAVRSPAVVISAKSASLSVSAGSTASTTLTLNSLLGYGYLGKNAKLNDYVFPVSLNCSNLPPHTTCSFSYSPDPALAAYGLSTGVGTSAPATAVNILCTGTTDAADGCVPSLPVTVTINTNVAVGTTAQVNRTVPISFAAIFGFGMVGLCFRRRMGKKWQMLVMLFMVIVSGGLAASLTACSTINLSPASVLTTPVSGTTPYSVIITAQQVGTQLVTNADGSTTQIYGSENQVSLPFTLNVTVH